MNTFGINGEPVSGRLGLLRCLRHGNSKRGNPRQASSRHGVAFLMLVVVMLLVVVGATQSLIQNEIQARRALRNRLRSQAMVEALEQASRPDIELTSRSPWKLPLADADDEHLQVSRNEAEGEIIVRWFRGGQMIDEMIREVQPAPPTIESIGLEKIE